MDSQKKKYPLKTLPRLHLSVSYDLKIYTYIFLNVLLEKDGGDQLD
jgi:hypothetical protein